jgi:hypothetical protein
MSPDRRRKATPREKATAFRLAAHVARLSRQGFRGERLLIEIDKAHPTISLKVDIGGLFIAREFLSTKKRVCAANNNERKGKFNALFMSSVEEF